jgi:flavoprotein
MVEVLEIKERKMIMKNSYTIKGLHTVSQYKIMQEINKNFEEESVDVYFVSDEEAIVKDKKGNQMKVLYRNKIVEVQVV